MTKSKIAASYDKVYSYKSITEAALAEMKFDDFIGSYTYKPIKSEIVDNVKTVTINVTSEGLPDYFPTDYLVQYVQIKGEGYFSVGSDVTGNKTEHLILPDCVVVGDKWETSTFWDKEELISHGNVELPIGYFDNCITIERVATQRTDTSKKVGEKQFSRDISCSGIGLVSSTTTNTINAVNFQTVTTMVLESYQYLE